MNIHIAIFIKIGAVLALTSARTPRNRTSKVQGGNPIDALPYVGALVKLAPKDGKFVYRGSFCTSSLISSNRVLAAAHCFPRKTWQNGVRTLFIFGLSDIRPASFEKNSDNPKVQYVEFRPQDVVLHPNYGKDKYLKNDIAVIKLPQTIRDSTDAEPICLADEDYTEDIFTVGWGLKTCTQSSPETLRVADGQLVDRDTCSRLWTKERGAPIFDSQICSFFRNSKGEAAAVAPGDSGGPLFTIDDDSEPIQIGVTSYGVVRRPFFPQVKCTDKRYPQVFTRVASFKEFIKTHAPQASFC